MRLKEQVAIVAGGGQTSGETTGNGRTVTIERRALERQVSRSVIRKERDRQVPLGKSVGAAWDVATATAFLASDEAQFITGVCLPVDGGHSARIGQRVLSCW